VKIVIDIIVALVILGVGIACLTLFGQKPEVPTEDKDEDQAALVETVEVETFQGPLTINVDGEASSLRVVTVGVEIKGVVIEKTSRSGDFVKEGDLLFRIDPTDYELEVERLEAQQAQLDEELKAIRVEIQNTGAMKTLAEEDLELQRQQLNRTVTLFQRNGTTENALDDAKRKELTARNALQTLDNQVTAAEQKIKTLEAQKKLVAAQLQRAREDVKRCNVTAPISGRVVDDLVEVGDSVRLDKAMMHISDSSKMEIKCNLKAEELAWIWEAAGERPDLEDPLTVPDQPVEVTFEFQGIETIWDGHLSRFEGSGVDRDTRTFPCRFLVPHPDQPRIAGSYGGRAGVSPPALLSGMYVNVRIPLNLETNLLRVPVEAVRPGGQIWVYRDNKLEIRQIHVAKADEEFILIRDQGNPLTAGDLVIVSPLAAVADGMSVRDQSEDELAKAEDVDEPSDAEQTENPEQAAAL